MAVKVSAPTAPLASDLKNAMAALFANSMPPSQLDGVFAYTVPGGSYGPPVPSHIFLDRNRRARGNARHAPDRTNGRREQLRGALPARSARARCGAERDAAVRIRDERRRAGSGEGREPARDFRRPDDH